MIAQRLMPDPVMPGRPGMLTRDELAACVRILELVRDQRPQALIASQMVYTDQQALIALRIARYVRDYQRAGEFWIRLELTEAGALYLQQVTK